LRCGELHRLDRVQVPLGRDPAHELLFRDGIGRDVVIGRVGATAQHKPGCEPERAEADDEGDQPVHLTSSGSTRDTRSPGASPALTSIAVALRRPSVSLILSRRPPLSRYATGPSSVTNTASAGTCTTCASLSMSISPRNRIPGRSGT